MKNVLSNVFTGTLVLCAVAVTGMVARRELVGTGAPPTTQVAGWERLAQTGQRFGPPAAAVTIVEFSDFQCPFCARVQGDLRKIRRDHPGKVAVVYRHLPLDQIHPHARMAAVAAECAGAQGRFEAYHDILYARQSSIGSTPWADFAGDAGVSDAAAFDLCVSRRDTGERVANDAAVAASLRLDGTPAFIINGRLISGAPSTDSWKELIQEALRDAPPPAPR